MTFNPYTDSSDCFAPKPDNIFSKSIGYCYPSSPRAEYFNAAKTGGYFVTFNGDNAHTGVFKTLAEAEKYCDDRYPNAKWGYYSMRVGHMKQEYSENFQSSHRTKV